MPSSRESGAIPLLNLWPTNKRAMVAFLGGRPSAAARQWYSVGGGFEPWLRRQVNVEKKEALS